MEFNKSVSNPMLVGCIELLKAEDTPGHRSMFITELQKADLLTPALIEPAPVEDEEGNLKLLPGSRVQFPMLTSSGGENYFMGFTDEAEYRLWVEKNASLPTFAVKFDDYVLMLLNKDSQGNPCSAMGFVINPFGANLTVQKDMIANIMAGRIIQALKQDDKRPGQKRRVPASSGTAAGEGGAAAGNDGDLQEK